MSSPMVVEAAQSMPSLSPIILAKVSTLNIHSPQWTSRPEEDGGCAKTLNSITFKPASPRSGALSEMTGHPLACFVLSPPRSLQACAPLQRMPGVHQGYPACGAVLLLASCEATQRRISGTKFSCNIKCNCVLYSSPLFC